MTIRDFAGLIDPIPADAFFRDTWEKRPLAIHRNDPGYYGDLFSLHDVEGVIAFTKPRHSDLRVIKKDAPSPPVTAQRPGREDAPDLTKLYAAYHDGHTINVSNLQERWAPLATLCANLESFLGHPAGANMYLTPQNAQGFAPHFDTHDVFIVQTHGEKTWRLYEGPQELPLDVQGTSGSVDSVGALIDEVSLGAGDLLYIPRGIVHEARTSTTSSLHVTIGIYVFRWVDLVGSALMSAARDDARFREALPPGYLQRTDLQHRLEELLEAAARNVDSVAAVNHLTDLFIAPRAPRPDGHFATLDRVGSIDLETKLTRRAGMICRVSAQNASASINFPGGAVSGPRFIEPALHFIASAGAFRVRELPSALDDEAKRVLARRLVREGLLTIED